MEVTKANEQPIDLQSTLKADDWLILKKRDWISTLPKPKPKRLLEWDAAPDICSLIGLGISVIIFTKSGFWKDHLSDFFEVAGVIVAAIMQTRKMFRDFEKK